MPRDRTTRKHLRINPHGFDNSREKAATKSAHRKQNSKFRLYVRRDDHRAKSFAVSRAALAQYCNADAAFDVNNAADPTSNNSEARFASANTWLHETALARGWGLMCQSRLTRRSLLRAESSCPNKAAKPCEPPSLASWNGEKARRTMDPDDTSSILWRRRCYKRVIERSTWNCFCVTAACSNGAAVEICSAADHIGGGAYLNSFSFLSDAIITQSRARRDRKAASRRKNPRRLKDF